MAVTVANACIYCYNLIVPTGNIQLRKYGIFRHKIFPIYSAHAHAHICVHKTTTITLVVH